MKIAGLTDKGLHRSNNEDAFGYTFKEDGSLLAILCDGIGGSNAGDVASKIAVDTFLEDFKNSEDLLTPQIARDWVSNSMFFALVYSVIYWVLRAISASSLSTPASFLFF